MKTYLEQLEQLEQLEHEEKSTFVFLPIFLQGKIFP